MSTEIKKLSTGIGITTKISLLNDMILELEGMLEQGKFDVNELDELFSAILTNRKFLRNVEIGHTLSDYTDWIHYKAESGYSIWKIQPDNYAYNILNRFYFDNKIVTNKRQATAEISVFDKVFLGNSESGEGFTDNTIEAGTEEGTEFELMDDISDYLYLGLSTVFAGIKFEFQTRGMNYDLVIEYYSSESGEWKELTANLDNLVDNTDNFASDGLISWDIPADWDTTEINSVTKYWIRISTVDTPTTVAEAYYIVPGNSVESLLALSSSEFLDEDWKWCSYNGYVYVTIRNTGQSAYEGDSHITSTSSTTNKQNFFIYNHTFKADYEDSTYDSTLKGLRLIIDKDLTSPPESGLSEGDAYLIISAESASEWYGHENEIATYDGSDWSYTSPAINLLLLVQDEHDLYTWDGANWGKFYGEGTGDMLKSTYDIDEDGIVDKAETIDDGEGNSASASDVKDAVTKKHTQNTDTHLGIVDQDINMNTNKLTGLKVPLNNGDSIRQTTKITEVNLEDAVDKKHAQHSDDQDADEVSTTESGITVQDKLDDLSEATITFIIDGSGSEITDGIKGDFEIPFGCEIQSVTLLADQSGSIVIDIWKDVYNNFPPEDADSITASAPPTISSATKSQDSTLTDWTKTITAGDILRFNVDSCSTITRCTISLYIKKL